jgi:hypothetical protein
MEPSIFARMQWKRKCHPKFAQMQWKLPWPAIIFGSDLHACACAYGHGPVSVRGFMLSLWTKCLGEVFMLSLWTIYTIYVNYLRYLQKKHRTTINLWLMSHVGDRKVWLTRVGRFDRCMPAGRAPLHVPSCWARTIGWLGLPVTIRSPGLPIYLKSSS